LIDHKIEDWHSRLKSWISKKMVLHFQERMVIADRPHPAFQ